MDPQPTTAQAQKLESIGRLAAGIAHEINTPIQYVGDNTRFLHDAFLHLDPVFLSLVKLLAAVRENHITAEVLEEAETLAASPDVAYFRSEIPRSIEQSLEGVDHIARIVRAMKEFSHPGPAEKKPVNLNHHINNTIQVSRNEWKYVAEIVTDFDPGLPLVHCVIGEINQVVLNLIINAAHAIGDAIDACGQVHGEPVRGTITITTRSLPPMAEIRVRDTGPGIPEDIREKVFHPFFTTKPLGKGSGQGLSIAHSVVTQSHGGEITFETELGVGTTFIVRLPVGETR